MTFKTNSTIKQLVLITIFLSISPYICADNIENLGDVDKNIDNVKDSVEVKQGLNILLNEKEQTLLNTMEQKHQAESLINLMNTVEKLANYPEGAIGELLGDSPNQQVLKRIIRSLKTEDIETREAASKQSQQQNNLLSAPPTNQIKNPLATQQPAMTDSQLKETKPTIEKLIPVFAVAQNSHGITEGKVIFQSTVNHTMISVSEGDSFSHQGHKYQLLSVRPQPSQNGRFTISLKTPSTTKHHNWPR